MKYLAITIFCIIVPTCASFAQQYLGEDWVKVQYQLASKKTTDMNLYVELADLDSIKHVYHTISLVKKDIKQNKEWIIIQTAFNDAGICYYEAYADLKTKAFALQKAKSILKRYTLVYSSSTSHGLMDKYIVLMNKEIIEDLRVEIGSTEDLPNDIMITIGSKNIYKSTTR